MRWKVLGAAMAILLGACGDDESTTPASVTSGPTATTATSIAASPEAFCQTAADTLGAADPPTDLDGIVAGAGAIAALAGQSQTGTALDDALHAVADGADLLEAAAHAGEAAAIGDAAATLTTAYDELDIVAASLRVASCTSESWGRQVVIAAVDLTGAGG